MMGTTAEAAEAAAGRKSKKERHSFEAGWDVYNNEAQYRHYKKRVRKAGEAGRLDTAAEDDGETPDVLSYGQAAAVPTDRVEAMVGDLHDAALRNASYSRRRTFHEEADVTYINKRNEVFNKKIGRAFDGYTAEIKQNLERGAPRCSNTLQFLRQALLPCGAAIGLCICQRLERDFKGPHSSAFTPRRRS